MPADEIRKPLSVGFWFSLGHSTIVFALAFLLSVGVKALAGQVENDGSGLHSVTGVIGASVSGVFLWILGILNLVVLLGHHPGVPRDAHGHVRRGRSSRSSSTSAAS